MPTSSSSSRSTAFTRQSQSKPVVFSVRRRQSCAYSHRRRRRAALFGPRIRRGDHRGPVRGFGAGENAGVGAEGHQPAPPTARRSSANRRPARSLPQDLDGDGRPAWRRSASPAMLRRDVPPAGDERRAPSVRVVSLSAILLQCLPTVRRRDASQAEPAAHRGSLVTRRPARSSRRDSSTPTTSDGVHAWRVAVEPPSRTSHRHIDISVFPAVSHNVMKPQ